MGEGGDESPTVVSSKSGRRIEDSWYRILSQGVLQIESKQRADIQKKIDVKKLWWVGRSDNRIEVIYYKQYFLLCSSKLR